MLLLRNGVEDHISVGGPSNSSLSYQRNIFFGAVSLSFWRQI
jgi:hypothetical protein